MSKPKAMGCAKPIRSAPAAPAPEQELETTPQQQGAQRMIRIGQKAPDFEASAYYKGKFDSVKLSDYLGKWVVLCFYPGDFTFV